MAGGDNRHQEIGKVIDCNVDFFGFCINMVYCCKSRGDDVFSSSATMEMEDLSRRKQTNINAGLNVNGVTSGGSALEDHNEARRKNIVATWAYGAATWCVLSTRLKHRVEGHAT